MKDHLYLADLMPVEVLDVFGGAPETLPATLSHTSSPLATICTLPPTWTLICSPSRAA